MNNNCSECQGTVVIAPCVEVGCLNTNFGKCIQYSGANLYCASGAIGAFTKAGTAVVPGSATSHLNQSSTAVTGTGTGATFDISRAAGSNVYTVVVANRGTGYQIGNQVKVLGTALGGATPANDVVMTITELAPVISTLTDLDAIIAHFHSTLCTISVAAGLDYSSLNYSALRQNGSLTGIGTPITTQTQFVESSSLALSNLYISIQDYDTTVTLAAVTGTIPGLPGSYNLNQYLTSLVSYVISIDDTFDFSGVTDNPCAGYTFTSKPVSTDSISDYLNWITTNVCGMHTALSGSINSVASNANALKTYIAGAGAIPANINTSGLSGGSSTSTAAAALSLLVTQMIAANVAIAATPSGSYAVTWASCFSGSFPTNSVFKSQTWNYGDSATTIQAQLDRIAAVLRGLNVKFDASQFTVTTGSCGPTIALAAGVAFTPALLSAAVLADLGDVTTSSETNTDFFVYQAGYWVNKELKIIINGVDVNVSKTNNANDITYDLEIVESTNVVHSLVMNNTAEYTVANASRFPILTEPVPYGVKHGNMVTLHGVLQISPVGAGLSWTHLGTKIVATLPVDIRPSIFAYFNAEIYIKVGASYQSTYTRATGIVTPAGELQLVLMNPSGSLVLTTSDMIEVVLGGVSYAL